MRRLISVLLGVGLWTACAAPPSPPTPTPPAPPTATAPPASTPTPAASATPSPVPSATTPAATPIPPTITPTLLPSPRPAGVGTAVPQAQPLTAVNAGGLTRLARWPLAFAVQGLVFSASGRGLWAGGGAETDVWRVRDGVLIRREHGPVLSPDGLLAVETFGVAAAEAGAPDDLVYVLKDLAAGAERTRWQDPKPAVVSACQPNMCAALRFAPNGGSVAEIEDYSGGRERPTLKLWGIDGQLLWTAPGVQTLTYSPDGTLLLTRRATTPPIDIWRVRDGALLKSLAPAMAAGPMAVSPDGTRVALADAGQVQVWRWAVGTPESGWPAANAVGLAFNADGSLLAGGFADRVVIWSTTDGRVLLELPVAGGGPLALSADGRSLALFSDGALELWGVPARFRP